MHFSSASRTVAAAARGPVPLEGAEVRALDQVAASVPAAHAPFPHPKQILLGPHTLDHLIS